MAEEYDLEAVVRFYAEGQARVQAEVGKVQKDLDALHKSGKITESTFQSLATAVTQYGKALKNAETTSAVKQMESMGKAARDQQNIYNDYLAKQSEGTQRQQQAARDNAAAIKGQETARKSELASLRAAIQGRYADADAREKSVRGQEKERLRLTLSTTAREQDTNSLIRQRYALYDVATTYGAVSAAALAAVGATTNFAAKYESAFSAVERTTLQANGAVSGSIDSIRRDLYSLSTEIPIAFDELSRIASLGAQLGVAEEDLASFTETISKFSAATNISVDEAALAFGRLGNLMNIPASQYRNLGSAIALVGVNSAATESQIVAVSQNIAAVGNSAGLTAEEVVALSATFASLGTAPELARSTTQQFFGQLNRAVAQGGERLASFAMVTGLAQDEIANLVNSGRSFEVLNAALNGLANATGPQVTTALDDMGLATLRTEQGIQRLRQNTDLLLTTLGDAKQGFSEGVFLDQAFAKVLEDASSQLQILSNAFTNFLSVAGIPFLDFLKAVIPPAVAALKALTDFAQTPIGGAVLGWLGGITLLIGLITAYRATAALATASSYAMITAFGSATAGTVSLRGGITNLIGALLGVRAAATTTGTVVSSGLTAPLLQARGAMLGLQVSTVGASSALPVLASSATTAASGVRVLGASLLALGRATIVLAFLQAIISVIFDLAGTLEFLRPILVGVADAFAPMFRTVGAGIQIFGAFTQQVANMLGPLGGVLRLLGGVAGIFGGMTKQINGSVVNTGIDILIKQLGSSNTPGSLAGNAYGALGATGDLSGGLNDLGKSAGGAAKQVRTLVDYANDLQSVFSRAFDIRFKSQLAMDDVSDSWADLTDRIDEARIKLMGLQADKSIAEYFKSVADQYGDSLRGDKLAAEIADLNRQIAETQADASTELTGNTKAARANRKTITDLVKQYEDYITALAEGGADQATLNAAVSKSRAEFINQATALGYSNAQLQPYIASFGDLTTVINNVPRNITVTANTNPALQALSEFAAKATAAGAAAGAGLANGLNNGLARTARGLELRNKIFEMEATLAQYLASGNISGARYLGQAIREYNQRLLSGSYAHGGYTGHGGKYEPAGVVHRGEYVIPKEQVNQRTGLPYASALGNLQAGTRANTGGYAGGGFVSGGMGGVVILDQAQYNGLVRAMRSGGNQVGAQSIQGVVNALNARDSTLGRG